MALLTLPGSSRLRPTHTASAALAVTLLAAAPALLELTREQCAVGVLALVMLPVLSTWVCERRLFVTEPVIVLGIMWVLALTLPVLLPLIVPGVYRDIAWRARSPWTLDLAALWMYRAWAACCVAYWLVRRFLGASSLPIADVRQLLTECRLHKVIGLAGVAGGLTFLLMTGGQSYSHIENFATVGSFATFVTELRAFLPIYVFLYFHARGRGRSTAREPSLLLAVLGVETLIFGATSTKFVPFELCTAWVLGSATGRRRGNLMREFGIGAAALVFAYLTFYLVTAYRIEIKLKPISQTASLPTVVANQFDAFTIAVDDLLAGKELGDAANPYDAGSMLDRLAHVSAFALVLNYTQGYSPFEHSYESILSPLLALMPRDLVSAKVTFMNSGRFAQLMGWEFGGLSLSLPGSIYWSWGFEGIVPFMIGIGAFLAFAKRLGERDGPAGLVGRVLMSRLVFMMLDVGGEFQSLMIVMTRTTVYLLVLWLVINIIAPAMRAGSGHRTLSRASPIR